MSPARRSRREAAAGDGPPFGEKTVEVVLRPGRSGTEPWGACLVGCIGSFQKKVVGVAAFCSRFVRLCNSRGDFNALPAYLVTTAFDLPTSWDVRLTMPLRRSDGILDLIR